MKLSHLGSWVQRAAVVCVAAVSCQAQAVRVLQIDVEHVIHPLTVEIITQGLEQAQRENAAAVVIRLNTPGGLLNATETIIQQIVASPVPVITYVGPSGGKAASAGFMILIAGDVAAMAPGTNTGAAHPVMLGGGEMDKVMSQKVENDAAASVRAIADKRGRNIELAEQAVTESKSFTDTEALESNLIDVVANDIPELLNLLDGRSIVRFDGSEKNLELTGAVIEIYELTNRQRILLPLINPQLAFVLLILGALGIYVEFTHPGLIAPGVAGGDPGHRGIDGAVDAAHQLGRSCAHRSGNYLLRAGSDDAYGRDTGFGRGRVDGAWRCDAGGHRHSRAVDRLGHGHCCYPSICADHRFPFAACREILPL